MLGYLQKSAEQDKKIYFSWKVSDNKEKSEDELAKKGE